MKMRTHESIYSRMIFSLRTRHGQPSLAAMTGIAVIVLAAAAVWSSLIALQHVAAALLGAAGLLLLGSAVRLRPTDEHASAPVAQEKVVRPATDPEAAGSAPAYADDLAGERRYWRALGYEMRSTLHVSSALTSLSLDTPLDDEARAYLDKALAASRYALQLLDDAAASGRPAVGEGESAALPFDLRAMLLGVLEAHDADYRQRGLALSWTIDEGLPSRVVGDLPRLRLAVLDLLAYAAPVAGNAGVHLACRAPLREDGRCRLELELLVPGLPAEALAALQLSADGRPDETVAGVLLKLLNCDRQIRSLGGSLRVERDSALLGRLTVRLTLATAMPAPILPAASSGAAWQVAGAPLGARVLVVDDNSVSRFVAREMLTRMGLRVTEAAGGIEALQLLARGTFDLVLIDVLMPGMGGCELVRLIRANPAQSHLPLIAMTADTAEATRAECFSAGMDDVLLKPVDPQCLAAAMSRFFLPLSPDARVVNMSSRKGGCMPRDSRRPFVNVREKIQ